MATDSKAAPAPSTLLDTELQEQIRATNARLDALETRGSGVSSEEVERLTQRLTALEAEKIARESLEDEPGDDEPEALLRTANRTRKYLPYGDL